MAEVTQIIYIGKNTNLIADFVKSPLFKISVYHNPFHVYNDIINKKIAPSIILCDSIPQNNSGIHLYEQFKKNEVTRNISFCLVSSNLYHLNLKRLKKIGISDVFQYPFKVEEIFDTISSIIEHNDFKNSPSTKRDKPYHGTPLAKRIFDIIIASVALTIISPLILLVAVLVRLESKGPIFYYSKRVGSGYQIFKFYKIRSMYIDADKRLKELTHLDQYKKELVKKPKQQIEALANNQKSSPTLYSDSEKIAEHEYVSKSKLANEKAFLKFSNDPRITKIGKIIRNSSIDELPQLINVIIGDMSIVGNRPLPLYEAEKLTTDEWAERFLAPAGITGLWQVKNRGRSGKMNSKERKSLDNEYAKKYSFAFDIKLIFQTVPALFQKENV